MYPEPPPIHVYQGSPLPGHAYCPGCVDTTMVFSPHDVVVWNTRPAGPRSSAPKGPEVRERERTRFRIPDRHLCRTRVWSTLWLLSVCHPKRRKNAFNWIYLFTFDHVSWKQIS